MFSGMSGIIKKIGKTVNLVVDTSVWSHFLRRKNRDENSPYVKQFYYLLERQDCIHLIGVIIQELLDGIKLSRQFELITEYLEPFPLIDHTREDFIEAARLKNKCRKKGIQAGSIDFLIASVCINRNFPFLTADDDFMYIAKHCDLHVIKP